MAKSLQQIIDTLKMERDAILDALANDAVTGPMPDDSFEGQSVSFTSWRQQLANRLTQIREELAAYDLWEINTIQI
jgi:hypothetical protein